jgi:hypothetical protein
MSEPWEHILQQLGKTGQSDFIISAEEIKACGKTWKGKASQFEPRLFCYQTTAASRPQIFKDNGLYIMPIRNGHYLITKIDIYTSLEYKNDGPITKISRNTSSVVLGIGGSETSLIDNLRYAGVFDSPEILGEPIEFGPLLNGRHRISMDMEFGGQTLPISGVQYETDACFESKNSVLIIEGKSAAKEIDSFNTRQLYFPFRAVTEAIDKNVTGATNKKRVICLFIHNLNGLIHIWKYRFTDFKKMDSIILDGHYVYTF